MTIRERMEVTVFGSLVIVGLPTLIYLAQRIAG